MQQKNIHWFPGHMVKAMREIEERLRVIDVIIELADARAPLSSRNPFLETITAGKKRLLVMTKKDLCDREKIPPFEVLYREKGYRTLLADLNDRKDIQKIVADSLELGRSTQEKYIRKGMKAQPLRVMIVGIPNVGKSTLINRLAGRNSASVRNKPGHTRAQQWIRINEKFELLDTPGILPPHYEDQEVSLNLALIGSIREDILPLDVLYSHLIDFLRAEYPDCFKRYDADAALEEAPLTEKIARSRGLLLKGGAIDEEATKRMLLREFRDGILTPVVIDRC